MNNCKEMKLLTISDIIERKIYFTKNNNIFNKKDFDNINEGELLAYNEIMEDIGFMNEAEFTYKYLTIVRNLGMQFKNNEILGENEIERLSGYNNAIVSILECVNPIYKYCEDN